ncbi:MAG: hypothetical protein ACK5JF_04105 [Oscillospiraceae bacterium]
MIKKLMSLGLCICFALVAGVFAKPVEVKANMIGIKGVTINTNAVLIILENFGFGISGGKIDVYDGTTHYIWNSRADYYDGNINSTHAWIDALTPADLKYDRTKTYTITIPAGHFLDDVGAPYSWNIGPVIVTAQNNVITNIVYNYVAPTPPAPLNPISTGDDYYDRHYNYWITVYNQLVALPNNGKLTVDASGYNIDHVQHFVFDALAGTSRTLTFTFADGTYVIKGKNMKSIALGHNHTFNLLTSLGYCIEQL